MDKETDRYTITTFNTDGSPDLLIKNLSTVIANSWIKELEADSVDYYVQLTTVEETL